MRWFYFSDMPELMHITFGVIHPGFRSVKASSLSAPSSLGASCWDVVV